MKKVCNFILRSKYCIDLSSVKVANMRLTRYTMYAKMEVKKRNEQNLRKEDS